MQHFPLPVLQFPQNCLIYYCYYCYCYHY